MMSRTKLGRPNLVSTVRCVWPVSGCLRALKTLTLESNRRFGVSGLTVTPVGPPWHQVINSFFINRLSVSVILQSFSESQVPGTDKQCGVLPRDLTWTGKEFVTSPPQIPLNSAPASEKKKLKKNMFQNLNPFWTREYWAAHRYFAKERWADTSEARYFAKDTDVREHRLLYASISLCTDRVFLLFLTTYHFCNGVALLESWLSFLHHTTYTAGTTFLFSRETYRGAKLRDSEVD